MSNYVKKLFLLLILVIPFAIVSISNSPKVQAISGGDFQAGRIIDDNVFFDGNSMDIPGIQSFLNSKVPVCDTNGSLMYRSTGLTRAQWTAANGKPQPPYTCLKDYYTDVWGMAANQYCSAINYGRYSAAGIIYVVGKACNVSQKVLLVLLQKEESLVTDDWPWPTQYNSATGFLCTDSAPCDPAYAGFFNQVYYAAKQYQMYAKSSNNYNFKRGTTATIAYNPDGSCGGSSVNIQNQATAGLYNYTPYQPNSAALNGLSSTNPGGGDGCSAYGNRNFWWYYTNWFGNTYGIPFSASFRAESNESVTVNQSGKPTIWIDFQNTGAQFWKDDTSALPYYPRTRLAGTWPINRISQFNDSSWAAPNRPVSVFNKVFENDGTTLAADQHTVWPGQVGRFQFVLNNPPTGLTQGTYRENFELVQDGVANWWVPGGYAWQSVVVPAPFAAGFRAESSASLTLPAAPGTSTLSYDFENTGYQFWKDDSSALPYYPRTRLAGTWPINRGSQFADPSWLGVSRPVSVFNRVFEHDGTTPAADQHTVWPGQVARFQFLLKNPGGIPAGTYRENFEIVQDGVSNWWVPGGYAWQGVIVP